MCYGSTSDCNVLWVGVRQSQVGLRDSSLQYNGYNSAAFLADKPSSNGWIIDVGCGNGRKAATLYQKGFNLYMLDWKDNLAAARANMEATGRFKQWVAGGRQGASGMVPSAWDISGAPRPWRLYTSDASDGRTRLVLWVGRRI